MPNGDDLSASPEFRRFHNFLQTALMVCLVAQMILAAVFIPYGVARFGLAN